MINERIKQLREALKLSQKDLGVETDTPRTTIAGYEQGVALPNSAFLISLNSKFNVNIMWILKGEGTMFDAKPSQQSNPLIIELENFIKDNTMQEFNNFKEKLYHQEIKLGNLEKIIQKHSEIINAGIQPNSVSESTPSYTAYYEEPEETVDLPLAQNLAAGIPVEASDVNDTFPVPKKLIPNKRKKYCVAKIKGSSMTEAGIENGSCVLLEYTDQPIDGEIMVVSYNSNTTLKLLHQNIKGEWELLYQDGSGSKIEPKDGDWEVKGRFVAVLPKKRQ
nr:MAG TPA: SOS regulatory protein LexA [Bacteriophage sp.]